MVFADLFFVFLFFPLCLLVYFFVSSMKAKNIVLIVFSLIFYAWGSPIWILLLLFSAVFNWYMGLKVHWFRNRNMGKAAAALAILVNIGLLTAFHFTDSLASTINSLFGPSLPASGKIFPIGIGFFTLQAISYIVDCYQNQVRPQRHFYLFLLYVSLFPKVAAGPNILYHEIAGELTDRRSDPTDIYDGIVRFSVGLAKKVLLADHLWAIVQSFWGTDISRLSTCGTWYTLLVYALCIYFDFSGYSDMAIGIGRIFGFHFPENFDHPFLCRSITGFWQRWHISLGSFFRNCLSGDRVPEKWRNGPMILPVCLCMGLWHGASWNYLICGLYFGLFLLLEKMLGEDRLKKWPVWAAHIYSKLVILIGFGIFYFKSFQQLGCFFTNLSGAGIFTNGNAFADVMVWNSLKSSILLILTSLLFCAPVRAKITGRFLHRGTPVFQRTKVIQMICCIILLIICTILLTGKTGIPLLYWQY